MKMNYPMIFSGSLLMVDANNPAKSAKIELDFAHPGVLPTDSIVQTAIDNANEYLAENMSDGTEWRPATKREFFNHVMREKLGAPVRFATPGSEDFEPVDAGDEVKQLQREIKSLKEQVARQPCWIPVDEGLPEENQYVHLAYRFKGELSVTFGFYYFNEDDYDVKTLVWTEDEDGEHCLENVTHWMPLPKPPAEGE